MVAYNFSQTEDTFPAPFWEFVTDFWKLLGMVSVCLINNHVCIFFFTWILVKTLSKKFRWLWTKSFILYFRKDRYFLRFYKGSRNIYVNTGVGNWLFIFLTILPKHVYIGWKFQGILKSSISFIFYAYINVRNMFYASCLSAFNFLPICCRFKLLSVYVRS